MGSVSLTWDALAGYDAPTPNPATQTLELGGGTTFIGVYVWQTGSVAIDVQPEEAEWQLTGPVDFSLSDTDSTTVLGLAVGDYTLVW